MIMNRMADEGYRTSTIYQARITLFNMLDYAYQNEEAMYMLRKQRQKNPEVKVIPMEWSEYAFPCRKGTPVKNSTYDTMLFKQCGKIGIPRFYMHVLRHTFATRCIKGGM